MNLEEIRSIYISKIEQTRLKLSTVKNQIYRIGTLRLLLFIAGVAGIIYFYGSGWIFISMVIAVTFLPFLILVKYHNRLFYRKDYLEKKIEINENELSALKYDTSCFDGGKEYTDPAHLYSYDLDIFGENSLFQYINRTSTNFGGHLLAEWFSHPLDKKEAIEERQEAIRELTPELSFRQRFRILGLLYKGEPADQEEIKKWTQSPDFYAGKWYFKLLLFFVPATNLLLWILAFLGILSFNWPSLAFVFFVICSFSLQKGITLIQTSYGKKLNILSTYAGLMQMIEDRPMQSSLLKQVQNKLGQGDISASKALKQLGARLNELDQRNNILLSVLLDGSLFWQLRQTIRIENWKKRHAAYLMSWLEAIGETDTICSLATFAYNHPDYAYPVISSRSFVLRAHHMRHPLIDREKCIPNDIEMSERPSFLIITGANMAGKSTYLRTVGVNYLLACMGAPVCCSDMEIYPAHLVTSLRTSDSLTDHESYFFAELKRLKWIIDKLNRKEELFIILDEILKGTNSTDKQKGSFALIQQFMQLKATGIIATHDLLLGKLAELFPGNIRNYCFEADITNNELTFSYRLRKGVAQNMNACFLMKKMGISVEE